VIDPASHSWGSRQPADWLGCWQGTPIIFDMNRRQPYHLDMLDLQQKVLSHPPPASPGWRARGRLGGRTLLARAQLGRQELHAARANRHRLVGGRGCGCGTRCPCTVHRCKAGLGGSASGTRLSNGSSAVQRSRAAVWAPCRIPLGVWWGCCSCGSGQEHDDMLVRSAGDAAL
jgi:hypothetical protein